MASNFLSRLLPQTSGAPSVYETLREDDETSNNSDIEERAGMAVEEENLGDRFHGYEVDHALVDAVESHTMGANHPRHHDSSKRVEVEAANQNKWPQSSPRSSQLNELDDDVPPSLLIEGSPDRAPIMNTRDELLNQGDVERTPIPGPSTRDAQARWQTTQTQQKLYQDLDPRLGGMRRGEGSLQKHALAMIDPKEKALWRWANVENLDNFLREVYDYFLGNGIWCILLSRALNLLTLAFVVGFSIYLTSCIEFKKVPGSKTMAEIVVPQCAKKMSGSANFLIWLSTFLWIAKLFQYLVGIRRLRQMQGFYLHLLEIPDSDIQTISWQEVVKRLMSLRDSNPATAAGVTERQRRFMGSQSKQRMDAHDIANRLMRRDNYLIALINKDILDLTLPIPFLKNRQLFSKTLEWNLSLCILDYVFNEQGQVRPLFLKDTHRRALSDGLRRRFLFAGFMNVLCAPLIIVYFMMLYFFRYFTEYQRNPSQIGSRQYSPLAEWKFREFNELWHLFQRRINMSYPFASRYIDQFPKDKTIQLSRFVAFIAGALASILALASVIDPDLFLGFEITRDRTVLFYLGVFGTVWAVARGAVPEENLVFDPEYALNNVTEYTHYLPIEWRGRMHSDEVRRDFALLYQMKVIIFLEEILSMVFTPFILWFSLPKCSDQLIDFFREFTVHVDGLGYVCSFAVFDFQKGGSNTAQQRQQLERGVQDFRDEYYSTKDGKMLASYYGFIDNYVTNPRQGVPFLRPPSKAHFHLPPTFPGLRSPNLAAEPRDASNPDSSDHPLRTTSRPRTTATRTSATYRSVHRTPRFSSTRDIGSPMTSTLLDPQHQPLNSGARSTHRSSARSRLQTSRIPFTNPIEDNGVAFKESEEYSGGTSRGDAEESNLGESWRTTRAGGDEPEDGKNDVDAVTGDKGAGVLGLIYQFQKAQTEGRLANVNI